MSSLQRWHHFWLVSEVCSLTPGDAVSIINQTKFNTNIQYGVYQCMETENGWISRRMEGFNLLEFSGIYHRSLLEVNSRKRNEKNKIDDLMIIDT